MWSGATRPRKSVVKMGERAENDVDDDDDDDGERWNATRKKHAGGNRREHAIDDRNRDHEAKMKTSHAGV